jgi:hypothetical protein
MNHKHPRARREMDFLEVSDPLKGPALALSPQKRGEEAPAENFAHNLSLDDDRGRNKS